VLYCMPYGLLSENSRDCLIEDLILVGRGDGLDSTIFSIARE
jgi:hypothetical protein